MFKKTYLSVLFVAFISIFVLGAFDMVNADETCGSFNIQLLSVVRDHGDVFRYNYGVTSGSIDISKISLLNFAIDANLKIDPSLNPNISVHPPGEGSQADGWLEGVPQLQVLTVPAQSYTESDPLVIYVSGSGGNVGDTAAHTKAGNKFETCFISGPVPGLPVDVSVPSQKVVVLNSIEYCIDIDPRTGCPYPDAVPYECDDPSVKLTTDPDFVVGSTSSKDTEGPTTPTIIQGEGSNPMCPVSKAAHNPCQWMIIGGSAYGPVCWK